MQIGNLNFHAVYTYMYRCLRVYIHPVPTLCIVRSSGHPTACGRSVSGHTPASSGGMTIYASQCVGIYPLVNQARNCFRNASGLTQGYRWRDVTARNPVEVSQVVTSSLQQLAPACISIQQAWRTLSTHERRVLRAFAKGSLDVRPRCRRKIALSLVRGKSPGTIAKGGQPSQSQVYWVSRRLCLQLPGHAILAMHTCVGLGVVDHLLAMTVPTDLAAHFV